MKTTSTNNEVQQRIQQLINKIHAQIISNQQIKAFEQSIVHGRARSSIK